MTRYFFHVRDRSGEAADDDGLKLPSLSAARAVAVRGAQSLICSDIMGGRFDLSGEIIVTDESGARVMVLPFA